jgi:hypothetical protein
MKVFAALREDVQQNWVWLQDSSLPPRCPVKITNRSGGRSIFCEALQIDRNFLDFYNQGSRMRITDPANSIVIGAWFRAGLGGIATKADADLSVRPYNSWYGRFMACVDHPQTVVRVAAWLGLISVVLGVVGVALGVVSVCAA